MTKNDYNRLKEEADIERVVEYLGIPVTVRGSAKFVLCPLPDHHDTHASNCYFKSGWNNLYCQACGRAIQAIDLIMYTQNCSYGEAADTLWEIEGRPGWYYTEQKQGRQRFDLSAKEAELLHLHIPGRIPVPVAFQKDVLEKAEASKTEADVWYKTAFQRWDTFLSEKDLKKLVKRAAAKRIRELDQMRPNYLEAVKSRYFELEADYPGHDKQHLLEIAIQYDGFPEEEYTKLRELYNRAS